MQSNSHALEYIHNRCKKFPPHNILTTQKSQDNCLDRQLSGQTIIWTDNYLDRQLSGQTIVWTDNYLDRQLSGQTIIWTDNCLDRQPSGQTMLPKRYTMHPGNTSVFDTCDTHAVCAATPTYIIRFSPSSASTCIIRITESTIF